MAAYDSQFVTYGTCKLEIGAFGSSLNDMGYIDNVKVEIQREVYEAKTKYRTAPIAVWSKATGAILTADLKEITAQTICYGLGENTGSGAIEFGYAATIPDYFTIKLTTLFKDGTDNLIIDIPKCYLDGNTSLDFSGYDSEFVIPISFKACVSENHSYICKVTPTIS